MNAFEKYAAERGALNECSDCGVLAIAAATGKPYAEVHAVLRALGRRNRGCTKGKWIEPALERLGVAFTWLSGGGNTTRFRKNYAPTSRRFVMFVPHHFTAFVGGDYTDYIATVKRGRRVRATWEILN